MVRTVALARCSSQMADRARSARPRRCPPGCARGRHGTGREWPGAARRDRLDGGPHGGRLVVLGQSSRDRLVDGVHGRVHGVRLEAVGGLGHRPPSTRGEAGRNGDLPAAARGVPIRFGRTTRDDEAGEDQHAEPSPQQRDCSSCERRTTRGSMRPGRPRHDERRVAPGESPRSGDAALFAGVLRCPCNCPLLEGGLPCDS